MTRVAGKVEAVDEGIEDLEGLEFGGDVEGCMVLKMNEPVNRVSVFQVRKGLHSALQLFQIQLLECFDIGLYLVSGITVEPVLYNAGSEIERGTILHDEINGMGERFFCIEEATLLWRYGLSNILHRGRAQEARVNGIIFAKSGRDSGAGWLEGVLQPGGDTGLLGVGIGDDEAIVVHLTIIIIQPTVARVFATFRHLGCMAIDVLRRGRRWTSPYRQSGARYEVGIGLVHVSGCLVLEF